MLASPRFSGRQGFPVAKVSGFTLIELLTVVAIIMIVAGIAIGVQRGVYSNQANAKARGEIQAIATALERYKATYGTYPVVNDSATDLYKHLTGQTYSHYNATAKKWESPSVSGQSFIDISQMTTNGTATATATQFVDPWTTPYVYVYNYDPDPAKAKSDHKDYWDPNFFVLYSKGPDKKAHASSNTLIRHASRDTYFSGDSVDDIVYGLEN